MAVKVLIPTPLRQFTGKQSSIECSAATVGEALGNLTGTFSELKKHLFTDDGKIRSFVNVYLNDEDIRFLSKENTPTKDGDTISIVPSIAGGCSSAGVSPAILCSVGKRARRWQRAKADPSPSREDASEFGMTKACRIGQVERIRI